MYVMLSPFNRPLVRSVLNRRYIYIYMYTQGKPDRNIERLATRYNLVPWCRKLGTKGKTNAIPNFLGEMMRTMIMHELTHSIIASIEDDS